MSRPAGWARPMRSLRRSCFLPQMKQASSQEQSCLWTEALRKCRPLEGGVRHVRGRRATVHTRACSAESPDAVDSSKRPGWIVASGSVLESSVNRYRRTVGFQETGRRRSKCLARISTSKRGCVHISCHLPSGRQLSRNSTSEVWKWNELHVEGCRLLGCPTWLLLSVFGFVVLDSLIDVVVTELEHAINES